MWFSWQGFAPNVYRVLCHKDPQGTFRVGYFGSNGVHFIHVLHLFQKGNLEPKIAHSMLRICCKETTFWRAFISQTCQLFVTSFVCRIFPFTDPLVVNHGNGKSQKCRIKMPILWPGMSQLAMASHVWPGLAWSKSKCPDRWQKKTAGVNPNLSQKLGIPPNDPKLPIECAKWW